MSVVTNITRMYLTRSFKPFQFTNEYDQFLAYDNTKRLGLYIHIPFLSRYVLFVLIVKFVIIKLYVMNISII